MPGFLANLIGGVTRATGAGMVGARLGQDDKEQSDARKHARDLADKAAALSEARLDAQDKRDAATAQHNNDEVESRRRYYNSIAENNEAEAAERRAKTAHPEQFRNPPRPAPAPRQPRAETRDEAYRRLLEQYKKTMPFEQAKKRATDEAGVPRVAPTISLDGLGLLTPPAPKDTSKGPIDLTKKKP